MTPYEVPDILGMLSEGRAIVNRVLHCAIGIHPDQVAVGQPFEILILLQNACDQPLNVNIQLLLPHKDKDGNRVSFFSPRLKFSQPLEGLEAGLLLLPVIVQPPTPEDGTYPVLVSFSMDVPANAKIVRPPIRDYPTAFLRVSSYRLMVLREIEFSARERKEGEVGTTVSVISGRVPLVQDTTPSKYESLWTTGELDKEHQAASQQLPAAHAFANRVSRFLVMDHLNELVERRFDAADLPLFPGETLMITKLLTYVLDEGLSVEKGFELEKSTWFQRLCRLLSFDSAITDNIPRLLSELFTAIIQDATLVGLHIVDSHLKIDVGNDEERLGYAQEIQQALSLQRYMTINHVYLPLVMAGVTRNHMIRREDENLLSNMLLVEEAMRRRERELGTGGNEVFELTQRLIDEARVLLRKPGS